MAKSFQIMGIVNCTPDSFYDGGQHDTTEKALAHACRLIGEGASIIDIGGESSRPGAQPVSLADEAQRVLPVIEGLRQLHPEITLSIDTTKVEVARDAVAAGASIINDIGGFANVKMAQLLVDSQVQGVLMHMLGKPQTMQQDPRYDDVVQDIFSFFEQRLLKLSEIGVKKSQLVLDPGIGFGKTVDHNLTLLRRLEEFLALGCPLLVGASRKWFIGKVLGGGEEDRLEGSLAAAMVAYQQGATILRVHDVLATKRMLKLVQAIEGV